MKIIKSNEMLRHYMELFDISSFFSSKKIRFSLIKYEKGELIPKPFQYFYFVVEGVAEVYSLSSQGASRLISKSDGFLVLGDTELTGKYVSSNFVEAGSDLYCVGISFARYKDALMNDNRFLRFALGSVTEKLFQYSPVESDFGYLEERLLSHFQDNAADPAVSNMGALARQFHVSQRHLQRTIRKLLDDGKITRVKRGVYERTNGHNLHQGVRMC